MCNPTPMSNLFMYTEMDVAHDIKEKNISGYSTISALPIYVRVSMTVTFYAFRQKGREDPPGVSSVRGCWECFHTNK